MYEIITMDSITNNIIQETLRKYLNSFSFNGFSWLSSGQTKKILIDDIKVNIIIAVLISYNADNLIIPKEIIIYKYVYIQNIIYFDEL